MRYLRLLSSFIRLSFQQELAHRADFFISIMNSLLGLGTGILGIAVLFGQVEAIQGWNFPMTLALLGVYMMLSALSELVISPSTEALAGMGGEIWNGTFDFTVLRPVNIQFLVSLRYWSLFSLIDLLLGVSVLVIAIIQLQQTLTLLTIISFIITLCISLMILYAILLTFAALVFWSPGFLFTWIFQSIFQMARYPVELYPGWVRLALTWVIPVGIMTTVPAQAISGTLPVSMLAGSIVVAIVLFIGASFLFHIGLRRYASASS